MINECLSAHVVGCVAQIVLGLIRRRDVIELADSSWNHTDAGCVTYITVYVCLGLCECILRPRIVRFHVHFVGFARLAESDRAGLRGGLDEFPGMNGLTSFPRRLRASGGLKGRIKRPLQYRAMQEKLTNFEDEST